MAAISIQGVDKRFGHVDVIKDFNLNVEPGEFLVFLGPSGCGKSTLLRMIAGLEPVTAGRISIGERDVTNLPPGARNVAMVFQHYALYPHMTVYDNMAFGLRNIGVDAAQVDRRVKEAARMLELTQLLQRKPSDMSGGQRQRVAIGRAVVKEPGAFLFDEPLSNLDAALRARTRVELAQLHHRLRSTMVFVTHDQVEAMTLASRIVVMNAGKVEQLGRPMEIYRRPATRFVASFIGAPAMNFLEVSRAASPNDHALVRLPDGSLLQTQVPLDRLPADGKLELGFRPEAFELCAHDAAGAQHGTVEVMERLGDQTHIHVALRDGGLMVARTTRDTAVDVGQKVALTIDPAAAHLFDAQGRGHHAVGVHP